jgi:hypothetical protein
LRLHLGEDDDKRKEPPIGLRVFGIKTTLGITPPREGHNEGFLSYGHDRNAPLVTRISEDLGKAGHEPWLDSVAIKSGADWRREIAKGLDESEWTLAFLSKHSTRDPGVCLDELAIALNVKAGA